MRRRPRILIILALLHLIAPFCNLIWDAHNLHMPLEYFLQVFFRPQTFSKYSIHFFSPMVAGIAILAFRRWSFFVYMGSILLMGFVSYKSYLERHDADSAWVLGTAYAINIFIVTYFLLPSVRKVYFDPKLRWWQTQPRFRITVPCEFLVGDRSYAGMVSNFSLTGLFIKGEHFPDDQTMIQVKFRFKDITGHFSGEAIRHAKAHLEGFGVRFVHDANSKKLATQMAKEMKAMGLLMKDRTDTDTFWKWLKDLITTGRGLTPTYGSRTDGAAASNKDNKN